MFGGIGTSEILLILLLILLLFGAKRIPEIAKGMGKGITEFKKAVGEARNEIETTPQAPASEATRTEPSADPEKTR